MSLPSRLLIPALLLVISMPALIQFGLSWRNALPGLDIGPLLSPPCIHVALVAGLLAIAGRVRRVLWLLLPTAFLALPEGFYLLWFGQASDPHLYGVIADANFEEVQTWLGPWFWPALLGPFVWLGLLALMAREVWRQDWRWAHRSRAWVLVTSVLLAGGLFTMHRMVSPAITKLIAGMDDPYLEYSVNAPRVGVLGVLEPIYPWGLPLRWASFREHQHALESHIEAIKGFNFDVRWRAGAAPKREVIVLVIGETGRPNRWRLFGAGNATTPRLSAREDVIPFTDAVSGAAATREAVPLMITRRPPQAMLAPSNEPSLVTAFHQAGFRTYWLSTQGTAGRHETPISVLAREADEQHFINAVDYRQAGALDGELLPLMQKILARPEPRQLIVLHTLGSHLNYAHRYPRDFEKFRPALQPGEIPDIWSDALLTKLTNAYDNSVLYTDFVLDQAIDLLNRTGAPATLLYAADHGESLFDGTCGRGGHGFASELNYRVPMLIWTSPAWQQARPRALAALKAHANAPISTLSIFATMNGLAGFDVAQPSAHGDLSTPDWRPAERQLTHFGDFDRVLKGRSCASNVEGSAKGD